jgi:hypothetical protein
MGYALADERFCLSCLATFAVAGISVAAVYALLTESGSLPDQVVYGTLQLGHAVLELFRRRAGIHELPPKAEGASGELVTAKVARCRLQG